MELPSATITATAVNIGREPLLATLSYFGDMLALETADAQGTVSVWNNKTRRLEAVFRNETHLPKTQNLPYKMVGRGFRRDFRGPDHFGFYDPSPMMATHCQFDKFGRSLAIERIDPSERTVVSVWNVQTGSKLFTLPSSDSPTWSHDCRFLAVRGTSDESRKIRKDIGYWHQKDSVHVWKAVESVAQQQLESPIPFLSFHKDGTQIEANGFAFDVERDGGALRLVRKVISPGGYRPRFQKPPANMVVHSPDGNWTVVFSNQGKNLVISNNLTSATGAVFESHSGEVLALAVSSDSHILASGGVDSMIRFWDLPTGRELAVWKASSSVISALAFDPTGEILASGSDDGTLKLWNIQFLRQELRKLDLDW